MSTISLKLTIPALIIISILVLTGCDFFGGGGGAGAGFTKIEFTTVGFLKSPDGSLLDMDTDGDLDAVLTTFVFPPATSPMVAMKNDGLGGFTVSTAETFAGNTYLNVHPREYAVADFTGDGKLDFFVADHGADVDPFPGDQNLILIQGSAGTMIEESASRIPIQDDFTHAVAVRDIDMDGDIDIFVGNVSVLPPYFLINNGTGVFSSDLTRIPPEITNGTVVYLSSILVDVDGDADLDLVLGHFGNSNVPRDAILLNDGTGNFIFGPPENMPLRYKESGDPDWQTTALNSADFNNDGFPDLIMSTQLFIPGATSGFKTPRLQLLLNDGTGVFSDASANMEQTWVILDPFGAFIHWVIPVDLNNDGWIDIVAKGAGTGTDILMNVGNANFVVDLSIRSLLLNAQNGVLPGDVDNDGDVDILVLNNGTDHFLLRNDLN